MIYRSETGEYEDSTELKVEYRFGNEVTRKDRREIRRRIKSDFLVEYLSRVEGLYRYINGLFVPIDYNEDNESFRKEVKISPFHFVLGMNLMARANRAIPLEEMFDIEGLNQAILTGELPEKFNEEVFGLIKAEAAKSSNPNDIVFLDGGVKYSLPRILSLATRGIPLGKRLATKFF